MVLMARGRLAAQVRRLFDGHTCLPRRGASGIGGGPPRAGADRTRTPAHGTRSHRGSGVVEQGSVPVRDGFPRFPALPESGRRGRTIGDARGEFGRVSQTFE
jgi:hypothetical protein